MTNKELKKLRRAELLEMLLQISKENEELRKQLAQAQEQLKNRQIAIANSGSLAEASMHLNGVFKAADEAARQYIENIRMLNDYAEARRREADAYAAQYMRQQRQ